MLDSSDAKLLTVTIILPRKNIYKRILLWKLLIDYESFWWRAPPLSVIISLVPTPRRRLSQNSQQVVIPNESGNPNIWFYQLANNPEPSNNLLCSKATNVSRLGFPLSREWRPRGFRVSSFPCSCVGTRKRCWGMQCNQFPSIGGVAA